MNLLFFIALGLQQAASSCIGHEIGKGNAKAAKEVFKVALYISMLTIGGSIFIFFVFHNHIIKLFTNIKQVHILFDDVFLLIVSATIPDMMKVFLLGVIKALGV